MNPAVILHLSDTHRTAEEQVSNAELLQYLTRDIRGYAAQGIPTPNIVLISGDITQRADVAEYTEAEELITGLLAELKLSKDHLILVPGNHDVHWPNAEKTMKVGAGTTTFQKEVAFKAGPLTLHFEDEAAFQERLENFRNFYSRVKGRDYPKLRAGSFTLDDFPNLGLTVVGLSSVDRVHQHYLRGELSAEAIRAATESLGREKFASNAVVAAWHHDLDWLHSGAEDCLDPASLRLASTAPFHLALCGHTHRPASNDAMALRGLPLPVIAAGSLCAGPRQRPESIARSYNVIEFRGTAVRTWVRIKRTRSEPWTDCAEFGPTSARVSWYDVNLRTNTDGGVTTTATETAGTDPEIRFRNPFSASNAKSMPVEQVLKDYVWTSLTDDAANVSHPQIIVGARGSGKTALLLTLTAPARQSGRLARIPSLGLYCPMKLTEVTAFNGKGWMPEQERAELFKAFLAINWALALSDTVEILLGGATRTDAHDAEAAGMLARAWQIPSTENVETLAEIRARIREYRKTILLTIADMNESTRSVTLSALRNVALMRGGPGPLEDAAVELEHHSGLRVDRWLILFDEVEFLNPWQQRCVYDYLANPTQRTSCKIATLPYAHTRALGAFQSVLVLGDDYSELPLVLGTDSDFHRVAKGLWLSRQRAAGLKPIALDQAWPDDDYFLVLREYTKNFRDGRAQIENELINDLPLDRQEGARKAQKEDRKRFGDEFWRKYREPLKFRIAKRAKPKRASLVPLYWGWRQMLKACGNNPRQFLKLLEMCWLRYWTKGIRPLRPHEQYEVLRDWASEFTRRCATLPHRGAELKNIVDRVARRLVESLHAPQLSNERLSIRIEDCDQEQAEAIAIGIAYGFLVPRLAEAKGGSSKRYPADNIVMRLGYPVAVANELPLRQGECLRISSMRQLELSWWTE